VHLGGAAVVLAFLGGDAAGLGQRALSAPLLVLRRSPSSSAR